MNRNDYHSTIKDRKQELHKPLGIRIFVFMHNSLTPAQRHANMAAIHSADTKPEIVLRHELWRRGVRYRVNDRRLPGSPDVVLPKYRTVVFVHGCFWHGHKGCSKYTVPKTNTEFWTAKVARNQARDQEVWRKLEAKGWAVIIVWECELEKARLAETIDRVSSEIIHNGELLLEAKAARQASRTEYLLTRRALSIRESAHLAELKDK